MYKMSSLFESDRDESKSDVLTWPLRVSISKHSFTFDYSYLKFVFKGQEVKAFPQI